MAQRAVEMNVDASGRTTATLLPTFDTITYTELLTRVDAVAAALAGDPVKTDDRVAILGSNSIDYMVIDTALTQLGAVSVPLQNSAALTQLQPIIEETTPTVFAASIGDLAEAIDLITAAPTAKRLVVFDIRIEVDDEREALESARTHLAGLNISVETLSEVIARGVGMPEATVVDRGGDDSMALLIYTSGSTGAPKGAIYTRHRVAAMWRTNTNIGFGEKTAVPALSMNFMPMSHVMGRAVLTATLAAGGTAYFAARRDLSTLLEDLSLVKPTQIAFVPRIWDMLRSEFASELSRRGIAENDVDSELLAQLRDKMIGHRYVTASTGSAPMSPELRRWAEYFLDTQVIDGYGSTEEGIALIDGKVQHPPVIDYKLVDLPDLGYLSTDRPYPRGELLIKTEEMFPGYYKRPNINAEVFDDDGFYRTGDVFALVGPDELDYVDRRNNVLKLSQGEFVTVSKLETVYGDSPVIRQIYVYGNSAQPFLLAVVVPSDAATARYGDGSDALRAAISTALQDAARQSGLQSYEIPRDFIVEPEPFTVENGLLTGVRKLAWPKLKERYGARLEALYIELADDQAEVLDALRRDGASRPTTEIVPRAAAALLGAPLSDLSDQLGEVAFTDLGGDSLSALTFANLLNDIYGIDVPVGVIVSPASDLNSIAAFVDDQRGGRSKRPTFASVHGVNANEVHASELSLDKFVDQKTLAGAPDLPKAGVEVRTVLLTGATGFLGRYLALHWLERMEVVGGKVIALVRARSDTEARERLDKTFDSGDPGLLEHYRGLAADHLEVIAGDKGEADLGLNSDTWQHLADTVDLIVDPAALVNHVLPYSQLFGPNVLGTAELIRIAMTSRIKSYIYVSTLAVGMGIKPEDFTEDADVRVSSAARAIDDSYANGYGTSKWGGEVLLHEAHDLTGMPISVFRCDMILADTRYAGQLNVPDMFTRMILSLILTGTAPKSFYELDAGGHPQRAHYDGLPVEFIAEAISTIGLNTTGATGRDGFRTYHVLNPHDDGISEDTFVDWLDEAGYAIRRADDYSGWLQRFTTTLRALPERQKQASLLPLIFNYQKPEQPHNGASAPVDRFRAAVQDAKIGPDKDIPHITKGIVVKYATDLDLLGLL